MLPFERAPFAAFIALALGCGGGGETLGSIGAAIGDGERAPNE